MELAENLSIQHYIDRQFGIPEHLALRFIYFTSRGISYLQNQMILHRGIKPENILIDSEFNVKICDFGNIRKLTVDEKRCSTVGSYEYMSPEVAKEARHDFKTDIWSLGIFLYEMLHGYIIRKASLFSSSAP